MDKKKLGQALIKAKKLDKEKFKHALEMHKKIGGDFAHLLVKLGYVSDKDITEIIAKIEGIPIIDIDQVIIPEKLMESIPRDIIEKHCVIPIRKTKDGQLTLAMADVNDYEAIEEIQFLTGCKVETVLASRESLKKAITQFYWEKEDSKEIHKQDKKDKFNEIEELFKRYKDNQINKALIELLIEKKVINIKEIKEKLKK